MHRLFVPLVLILALLPACGTSAPTAAPAPTVAPAIFTQTPAAIPFPTGRFIKTGSTTDYGLQFNEDGTYTVFEGANTFVNAAYKVENNVLTETSNTGGCKTNVSFHYTFDGSNLTLSYVGDPKDDMECGGPYADFNNVTYILAKEKWPNSGMFDLGTIKGTQMGRLFPPLSFLWQGRCIATALPSARKIHSRRTLASRTQGPAAWKCKAKSRPIPISIRFDPDPGKASDKKKIVQLLESAASDYQQEKYEKALGTVEELLSLDPDNDEAQQLKQQIQKAQRIAELVKKEEARTRAEQASLRPAQRAPVPDRTGDPWGASTAPQAQEDGLELPPEEAGPVVT